LVKICFIGCKGLSIGLKSFLSLVVKVGYEGFLKNVIKHVFLI
jgi:hypothetical protein